MYSRFVALRVRPAGHEIRKAADGQEPSACWLLAEWPATEPEPVQSWLSDLLEDIPSATLVRLAKLRRRIEHDYREMKQALGPAHFEGRTWRGWHHHVTLLSAAHDFCTLQRPARAPKDTALAWASTASSEAHRTPRGLDRRLPHLSSRHTHTGANLTKPY
ncbi:hypothetical protein LUX00_01485 [Streptomyces sudanensis]|nr:hypothetical protein [Streptomyces sudanensis]